MLLFVLPMAVLTLFLTVVLPRGYVEFSSDTVVVQNSVRRFELPLASVEQFVRGESYRSAQLILVDNRWVYCHGVQPWLRYTDPGYMKVIDEMNTELAQRKARLVGEAAADPAR